MDLKLVLLAELAVNKKLAHIVALVALQLDDLSVLGVIHHASVARKLLLNNEQKERERERERERKESRKQQ